MSRSALLEHALDLFAQVSERQMELSTPAHLAVMQAFNVCAELATDRPVCGAPSTDPIKDLLRQTSEVLLELSRRTGEPGLYLRYFEACALLDLAARQS